MNTVIDLKEALEEASHQRPPLPNVSAIARDRGKWHQRLRVVAVATASVVVLAGLVGVAAILSAKPSNEPQPLDTPKPQQLPMYQHGYKLFDYVESRDSSGAELTFTVPQKAIALASTCAGPKGAPNGETFIDGEFSIRATCDTPKEYDLGISSMGFGPLTSGDYWTVTPGEPLSLTQQWADAQPHEESRWLMGVYVKVPIDEYVFQGSAADIAPVPTDKFTGPCAAVIQSTSADMTFSCQLTVQDNIEWNTWSSAPGEIRITGNNIETVHPAQTWEYGRQPAHTTYGLREFDVQPGDTITMKVEWTPFTDDESELGIAFTN